jgi:hypothetical protein
MRTLWEELYRSRAFWLTYLREAVDFNGSETLRADDRLLWGWLDCGIALWFSMPSDYELRLDIFPGGHQLELCHSGIDKPLLLGTVNGHQMSDLFRWDECQAVTRHLAKSSGPAWAHELLFSLYVAVTADCADQHAAMLRRSLEASEVFSGPEVEHILAYSGGVAVRQDFRWLDTPGLGWVAEGSDAHYCMRHTRGGFDFARFSRFLAALTQDTEPS